MRAAKIILFLWALLFAAPAFAQTDNLKIIDCYVNTTAYTFAAGQAGLVACDNQGRLVISPQASQSVTQGTSPWVDNISQFGGSNVVTGTGTGGAGIPRVTVSSDSFPSIQPVSGTVTANQGGAPWSTTDTNAANAITSPGTAATKAIAVQGVSGGANINVIPVGGFVNNGQYNATLPSLANGAYALAYIDQRGQYKISETGSSDPLVGVTPAVAQSATSLVGKAAQGNLYGAYAILTASASAQTYLACINATAAPTAGAAITPIDVAVFQSNAIGAQASVDYKAGPPNGYSAGITCLVTTSLIVFNAGSTSFIQERVR